MSKAQDETQAGKRRPGEIRGLDEEAARSLRVVALEQNILEANETIAAQNRETFQRHKICVLNLISSPGAGKTTLLVETLRRLKDRLRCAVIEGDQQTSHDAQRIAETGVPVVQINTHSGCHLNAAQVRRALDDLPIENLDLIFIENVGNLVCPSNFDLGEYEKVVIMSITEGEDKPIKYPLAFNLAKLLVLTKMDLLPHLRFDLELCKDYAQRVNPKIIILETSAFDETGLNNWLDALQDRVQHEKTG
ncbi:MAG: hydrogenase nickel incorporation protein HypB [Anaerolineaceae bacterium]|nr:hydrogenase nickel incorporation protein HypB [Anaerolineaceae bacterium]